MVAWQSISLQACFSSYSKLRYSQYLPSAEYREASTNAKVTYDDFPPHAYENRDTPLVDIAGRWIEDLPLVRFVTTLELFQLIFARFILHTAHYLTPKAFRLLPWPS